MSVPQSTICIVSDVPLDNRYEHSLYFLTRSDQDQYFTQKVVKWFTGYTYLRKNWSIKVEATMDQAHRWQYLFFKNPGHEAKTYYYFINKVSYVNDSTVELDLELDVIQTYMFDWDLKECFVEREHTYSDEIGEHTLDEGLEPGHLVNALSEDVDELSDMCIMLLCTTEADSTYNLSHVYDGVFSGLKAFAVPYDKHEALGQYLEDLSSAGKDGEIVSMWMYPKNLVRVSDWSLTLNTVQGASYDNLTFKGLSDVKANLFKGYTPKNNKLYCYPYNFMYVSNNNGGSAVYRYERFPDPDNIQFGCYGAIGPDAGVKIYPWSYSGANGYEEGITLSGFPTCAWDSDVYKVWLAQNQNTHAYTYATSVIQAGIGTVGAVASVATGNINGGLGGLAANYHALTQVQGLMAQKADMDIQPAQARGNFSSNVNVANGKQTFTVIHKCVSLENARCIDDYFTRYGYKVNRVKQPSIKNRSRFTYVKTVGCTVAGPIGNEDRLKIEGIFDKGITFWADHNNPCDYYEDNLCN